MPVNPPKTYITSPTRTAAWFARGDGMDPVHCSSVHFRLEMSNDQVSLYKCWWPTPPNLLKIVTRVESECKGHKHNDTVFGGYRNVTGPRKRLVVSGCGFIWLPKTLQFYCEYIRSKLVRSTSGQSYVSLNPMPTYH